MRPSSIIRFDRLYLASIVFGLIATILEWPAMTARLEGDPQLAALAPMPLIVAVGAQVIGIALSLLLWFFVTRRASNVARWIVVVFTVLSVGALLYGISNGAIDNGVAGFTQMLATALGVVATVNLFRADAVAWFRDPLGRIDA